MAARKQQRIVLDSDLGTSSADDDDAVHQAAAAGKGDAEASISPLEAKGGDEGTHHARELALSHAGDGYEQSSGLPMSQSWVTLHRGGHGFWMTMDAVAAAARDEAEAKDAEPATAGGGQAAANLSAAVKSEPTPAGLYWDLKSLPFVQPELDR